MEQDTRRRFFHWLVERGIDADKARRWADRVGEDGLDYRADDSNPDKAEAVRHWQEFEKDK